MSAMPSSSRKPFEVRGWHVFAGVAAFFAVVITVDVIFTVLAVRTFPGQVSVTPYEDGLLYNRKIAQMEAQEQLGWQAAAEAQPRAVMLQFQDREGRPVQGLKIVGRLERPATEAGKIALSFKEAAPGRYVAPAGPAPGGWDLTAEATGTAGETFLAERRLTWP
ncbi:ferredoxin [Phenylobacterium kunshanense]|uniref:Ferredoxin n=2 Tax=Phenylobacterium kunshanense TaxID=1445034 RepID=A0A328B7C5_9CAUL|nr:ferredoxin [Phenylobacterium kunshanense]